MSREFSKGFYNSKAWKQCRAGYIKSVYGLCESCREKGKITPGYIVHHTTVLDASNINDQEVTLNWDMLRYECLDCHNRTHGSDKEVMREGLSFDTNGNLIQMEK